MTDSTNTTNTTNTNAIVNKLLACWNSGDVAKIAALYAENTVMHHPLVPQPLQGRGAVQQFETAMFDAFSEIDWRANTVVENTGRAAGGANEVCVEFSVAATNTKSLQTPKGAVPATHKRIVVKGVSILKLNGKGEISEERRYFDTGSMFVQLGLA